jgi:hypothetical protein
VGLYGGRAGAQLTITDALTTGYRFLLKPAFSIPILVIGVVINLIVIAAFVPLIVGLVGGDVTDATVAIGGLVAGLFGAVIAAIIGGIVLNLYGQIWAVMASTGEPPTIEQALSRVRDRWISVLGAGIIVGAITLGSLIVVGSVAAALGGIGVLLLLVGIVVIIYIGIRLSLAGWIAAEGTNALDSVKSSWEITNRKMLLIVGWSIVIALVIFVITFVVGLALNLIPLVGPALTQTLGSAFGFGAGVTLYRRVKDV